MSFSVSSGLMTVDEARKYHRSEYWSFNCFSPPVERESSADSTGAEGSLGVEPDSYTHLTLPTN